MTKLSVFDQSPVREEVTPRDALFETIELARHADGLGYRRYWLAEHHGSPGLAGSAPEIMVALVAAQTRHLRVGSGGVMLSHYSSLKVAEQFRMLETLYPGRIDLGIGRAPGSDQLTAIALQHGPGRSASSISRTRSGQGGTQRARRELRGRRDRGVDDLPRFRGPQTLLHAARRGLRADGSGRQLAIREPRRAAGQ